MRSGFTAVSPSFSSRSNGVRPLHTSLICDTFEWCGRQLLGEVICRNHAGPALGRRAPCDGPRQPPKVVARLGLVCPGLDLLVAHTTSVEKMLAHGNFVYETRSWSLAPTATLDNQTPPLKRQRPRPPTVRRCFWTARSSRPSLTRRRRSAGRRTCSRRSRTPSRWAPSLGAARANPSVKSFGVV